MNYPIKQALNEMADNGQIDCDDPSYMYCVSWLTMQVATVGIKRFLDSWNNHRIPS